MFWYPPQRLRTQSNAAAIATLTPGTAVTTGATSSTKGSPTQIFASTDFDVWGVTLVFSDHGFGATASDACFDLLIGANDDVLIPDILCGYSPLSQQLGSQRYWFPLFIPAGVKVSGRAAGLRTSTTMRVQAFLEGGTISPPWRVGSRCTTYGITTVPDGTTVVAGNGSEGAWTQITASTTDTHFYLVPSFQATNSTGIGGRAIAVDYGVGGSGAEIQLGSAGYSTSNVEQMSTLGDLGGEDVNVATGSRLVMRASASAVPDSYNGALHGVT